MVRLLAIVLGICVSIAAHAADEGWVCPSACPGETDTEKVQYALDNHARVYLDRDYEVTSVVIHRLAQHVEFRGHYLNGIDEDPNAEALLYIRGRELTLRDVKLNCRYGYRAALRWHSVERQQPAQYNKIYGMRITSAKLGILYGAFEDPVNSAQSENAIFGLTFRSMQECIRVNQPNGFLYISGSVIDCNANEWKPNRPGEFDDAAARSLNVQHGQIEISTSEILKTSTQEGYMMQIEPAGIVKLANCHYESAPAGCLLRGTLMASNVSGLTNNDSVPLLDIPADAGPGFALLSNCDFIRPVAVSGYSGMPMVRAAEGSAYRVLMSNCMVNGWQPQRLGSPGMKVHASNVLFRYLDVDGKASERLVE